MKDINKELKGVDMAEKKKKISVNNPVHVDAINDTEAIVKRKNHKDNLPKIDARKEGRKFDSLATSMAKKNLLLALEQSLGVVTTACRKIGCNRRTHYNWMESDPEYAAAYAELADVALDFAETSLHKQILSGEVASTIFYLKTKGKNRGYIERVENAVVVRTAYDLTKLSEEELLLFSGLQSKMEL